jgi:hypothetical protein
MADQKETERRKGLSDLINLVEQIAALPTEAPAETPADRKGKKAGLDTDKLVGRFAAVRKANQTQAAE